MRRSRNGRLRRCMRAHTEDSLWRSVAACTKRTKLLQLIDKLEQQIARSRCESDLRIRLEGTPVDPPMSVSEQRRERHIRVQKPGKVILDSGKLHIDCVIEEFTATGAGLRLSCIFSLPETFELTVVGSLTVFVATKVWQQGIKVGVKFTDVRLRATGLEQPHRQQAEV